MGWRQMIASGGAGSNSARTFSSLPVPEGCRVHFASASLYRPARCRRKSASLVRFRLLCLARQIEAAVVVRREKSPYE